MKHFYSGMLVMLALVLATVMGVVALAESAGTEAPAVEEAPAAEAPSADANAADDAALQAALDAYRSARQSAQAESLEAELNGYVAAGKLTREQADLILKYYKDQEALRSGACPNCGYQFANGFGKGGRMGSGKNGRGNGGFGQGGRGGMRGFNSQPSNPGTGSGANGMAFTDDGQADTDAYGFDGI